MIVRFIIAATMALLAMPAFAEIVDVKYVGPIDIGSYECRPVTRSSLVNRVCYDESAGSMIALLKRTYYSYCDVPADMANAFHTADSIGRFYNQQIKSDAVAGRYACND